MCERIRENQFTSDIRILVTSAQDSTDRRIHAFEKGADDFIAKPFSTRELEARIDGYLKRAAKQEKKQETDSPSIISCGNIEINLPKMEVRIGCQVVTMSVLEFNLFKFFIEHKDCVLSRDTILEKVWMGTQVTGRTVDTHLVSLRKKIADSDYEFSTIYGAGYIFRPKRG